MTYVTSWRSTDCIKAQRNYWPNADLERAQKEEQTLKDVVRLARVGTIRSKDQEIMLPIIRQLIKNSFPRASRQMDINWRLGYVHFGISQSLWITMCANWRSNAVQGWDHTSTYTHDRIRGLDILWLCLDHSSRGFL